MRNTINILLTAMILFSIGCQKRTGGQTKEQSHEGTITISGAWALYPMAVKWAEEYQKIYPKVKIDIAAGGAGKGMADCLAGAVDIGMISRDINPAEIEKGAWWVSVTKDAVVATINEDNPALKELLAKGVRRQGFIDIWITGQIKNWGQVTAGDTPDEIHVYTRSDACGAAETWANFLGKKQEDLLGVGVYGDPGLADAVTKDRLGIGFNNVNYAYDTKTKQQIKGIRVIPIDFNDNGAVDEGENFYDSRDKIIEAIATGRYQSPPARALHFAAGGKPKNAVVLEFIRWVLTDGQKYVPESGYINLSQTKLQEQLKKLEDQKK